MAIHQASEYNLPLFINFIDFKAAFDSINRGFIWAAFKYYGLPDKYIRIIKSFFDGTVSAVRWAGGLSEWFEVLSGTGQGDIQGPVVFNVCLNLAVELSEMHGSPSRGLVLSVEGDSVETVRDCDYADDMAVPDSTEAGLQESTDLICKFSKYAGLRVNTKKTEAMAVAKSSVQPPPQVRITIEGTEIAQVKDFTYLGSKISYDGKLDGELDVRIGKSSGAFRSLGKVWANRNILDRTKVRIYQAAVLTILLYGSETWNTTKAQMHRMEVFHQTCLRRILRIKWYDRVSNVRVLKKAGIGAVEGYISSNRLRWFGHVSRMPEHRIPKIMMNWVPRHGKRSRGRPRKTWMQCVQEDASCLTNDTVTKDQLISRAQDRDEWRRFVRRARYPDAGHSNDREDSIKSKKFKFKSNSTSPKRTPLISQTVRAKSILSYPSRPTSVMLSCIT